MDEEAVEGRELGCDWYGVTEADSELSGVRLALTSTRLPAPLCASEDEADSSSCCWCCW